MLNERLQVCDRPGQNWRVLLFGWLVICSTLIILFTIMVVFLPASIASVNMMGPAYVPLFLKVAVGIIVVSLFFYYTWLMRVPNRKILAIGVFLFLWSSIRAEWSGGFISLTIAPPIHITLINNPSLLLQINIAAIVIASMFGIAWYQRDHQLAQATTSESSPSPSGVETGWACEYCETPVNENDKFCAHCGQDVTTIKDE